MLIRQVLAPCAVLAIASLSCSSGSPKGSNGSLVALKVGPLTMTPAFSPDIHDYVVYCAAGNNALDVTMQTTGGAVAAVTAPTTSAASASQSVSVSVAEDQAIQVTVDGDSSSAYWIRCLPHDFPQLYPTHYAAATPGWYVTGDAIRSAPISGFAMVLDENLTPVWYYRVSSVGGTGGAFNVTLLPSGQLSVHQSSLGQFEANPTAADDLHSLAPWGTAHITGVGTPVDEHELQVRSNGNYLVDAYPLVTGVDLTGLGTFGAGATMADCEIQELDANDALVWSWRLSAHADPVKESTDSGATVVNGLKVADPFHCNSIDEDASGNLLLSSRHTDALFYIEKATGKVLWKLGGTAYNKDGAAHVAVVGDPETAFYHQHDARLLDATHVTLFDDHQPQTGLARGVEYQLDLAAGKATFVTHFPGIASSKAMGSFRRYADGSNVVGWGILSSTPNEPAFTEFDDSGKPLLALSLPLGVYAYRAMKEPIGAFDVNVLRATAGMQ